MFIIQNKSFFINKEHEVLFIERQSIKKDRLLCGLRYGYSHFILGSVLFLIRTILAR